MSIKEQLQTILEKYEPELPLYAWASEEDRWLELINCLLFQCSELEPEVIRSAIVILQSLSLLEIDKLVRLNDLTCESSIAFVYVLKQFSFSEEQIQNIRCLLSNVAGAVEEKYGGKIQVFLRRYGNIMRDELVNAFRCENLSSEKINYAVSQWLQNALSLPISLQNAATIEFCEKNNLSLEDLWKIVDEMDINMALVDDLLEVDIQKAQQL